MVKEMRAEWYKAVRRPYFRIMVLIFALCGVGVTSVLNLLKHEAYYPEQINLPFAILAMLFGMVMGLFLVMLGADVVFSEQYKHNTLKNEVSFGLPRWGIYLSRWVVALAVMVVALAVLLGSYLLSSWLLLGVPTDAVAMEQMGITAREMMGTAFQALGGYLLASLPLWIGGLSVIICLMFLIANSTFATFVYLGLIAGLPAVLDKLGQYVDPLFIRLYHLTLSYPFEVMNRAGLSIQSGEQIGMCWAIGLGWALVSTAIGLAVFQRREIK